MGSIYDSSINYSLTIDDGLTKTTYDNQKDYVDDDTPPVFYTNKMTTTAGSLKKTTDHLYDTARRWYTPIQTTVQYMDTGTNGTSEAVTTYTHYNDYGDVTTFTDPYGIQTRMTMIRQAIFSSKKRSPSMPI